MATPDHGDEARWLSQEQRDRLNNPDYARFLTEMRGNLVHLSTADLERAMQGGSEDFQMLCRDILRDRGITE